MAERSDSARERAIPEPKRSLDSLDRKTRALLWVLLFVGIALMEIVGGFVVQARVPPDEDWARAAAFIDERWQPKDTAISSPTWADPILRLHLGERIGVADAGRADLAPYERLWEVSTRGHVTPWMGGREADLTRRFGRVVVRRYDLGPSPVLYDLTSRIMEAEVSVENRACTKQRRSVEGGGLFRGPMWPADRFFCGPDGWLWVGPTVIEDLHIQNRACVWQHPQAGNVPTTTTFRDVPLGDEIVLHAGLYYDHERPLEHGPVLVQVMVDGREVGRMVHRDGDGWERMVADTAPLEPSGEDSAEARGDVSIVVRAENPHLRTLCWAASVRTHSDRDDEVMNRVNMYGADISGEGAER